MDYGQHRSDGEARWEHCTVVAYPSRGIDGGALVVAGAVLAAGQREHMTDIVGLQAGACSVDGQGGAYISDLGDNGSAWRISGQA
jgi:hypothetical protein